MIVEEGSMKDKMNDAAYAFKEDVKERKSLLSGARHKKNGSKSRRCTLPSDNLSYYQRKKLNGEVKSYSMNRPMTWKEFQTYPDDLQETYLATLVDGFNVSMKQVGDMMGCCNTTLNRLIKNKNFTKINTSKGRRIVSQEDIDSWHKFLGDWPTGRYSEKYFGRKSTKDSEDLVKDISDLEIAEGAMKLTEQSASEEITPVESKHIMEINRFSIGYDGEINLNDVLAYLQLTLGDKFIGHLDISFRKD